MILLVLLDFLSTTRKVGEKIYASKEKSCKKEDRKEEEISFPKHVHTLFWLGKFFSSLFFVFFILLFLRSSPIMKLLF
jgi:hypothetical protein